MKTKLKLNHGWYKMSTEHHNEPRNAGYSAKNAAYYTEWIDNKKSHNIFTDRKQKDLFIFSMALGKFNEMKSDINDKKSNVSVEALKEQQKWAVLSIGISKKINLLCLKDEKPIYLEAEKYAEEGLKILKSRIDKQGINYPKALEVELKEILGII